MSDKYNGWTNYETWVVKLWMDNEQDSQEYWEEQAKETKGKYELVQTLKEHFDELNPIGDQASVYTDLLNASLSMVNWYEIAGHLIDEVSDEEARKDGVIV